MATAYGNLESYDTTIRDAFILRSALNADNFSTRTREGFQIQSDFFPGQFSRRRFWPFAEPTVRDVNLTTLTTSAFDTYSMDEVVKAKFNKSINSSFITGATREENILDNNVIALHTERAANKLTRYGIQLGIGAMIAATQELGTGDAGMTVDNSTVVYSDSMIVDAKGKFGDRSEEIVCAVMHSKARDQILRTHVGLTLDSIAGLQIINGAIGQLSGLPIVVVDLPELIDTTQTDDIYTVAFLRQGAIRVEEANAPTVESDTSILQDGRPLHLKTGVTWALALEGYSWQGTSGIQSGPLTDANLTAAANWEKKYTQNKQLGASLLKFKAPA